MNAPTRQRKGPRQNTVMEEEDVILLQVRSSPICLKDVGPLEVVYRPQHHQLFKSCRLAKQHSDVHRIDATDFCQKIVTGNTKWCSTLLLKDESQRHDLMLSDDILGLNFVQVAIRQATGMLKTRNRVRLSQVQTRVCVKRLVSMAETVLQRLYPEVEFSSKKTPGLSVEDQLEELQAESSRLEKPRDTLADQEKTRDRLRKWLSNLRETFEPKPTRLSCPSTLSALPAVKSIFPNLPAIAEYPVVFMCQSGSAMYHLDVPSSDKDYRLVYVAPSETLLSLDGASTGTYEAHTDAPYASDKHNVIEYSAVELLDFLRTAVKGNPNSVELLFTQEAESVSWIWQELVAMRRKFLTRTCTRQYVGYVGMHLKRAKTAQGRAFSKALYHVFHKLLELQRILGGEEPHVALRGEELNFVYSIRTKPLVDELAPENLLSKAEEMLDRLLEERKSFQGSELSDNEVEEWCLSVRKRLLE